MALFIDLSQARSTTHQKQLRLHFHYYDALNFELENKYADFFLTSANENVETHGCVTTHDRADIKMIMMQLVVVTWSRLTWSG